MEKTALKPRFVSEADLTRSLGRFPVEAVRTSKGGLVLSADHRNHPFEYWPRPSELELAHLAARLARAGSFDPKELVKDAWALYWESCRRIQEDHLQVTRYFEEEGSEPGLEAWELLPRPKGFPVRFAEMERLLLPGLKGRTAERAALLREFAFADLMQQCMAYINGKFCPVPYWKLEGDELEALKQRFKDATTERFAKFRTSIYDAAAYDVFATGFLAWHARWTRRRNSEAKAANARKGWAKRQKAKKAKTGARPKYAALREILEPASPGA
jgi:hypothetical protein